MDNKIVIKGCRENNLKNIDLEIPRNKFVVITGPSGSGKSSLAFDTLYKEGQRRYVESINNYGQQFLEQYQPPDVDLIEGLSPTIAIKSKRFTSNSRSTVATTSGIYDLLRILFANFGEFRDPETGDVIKSYTASEVVNYLSNFEEKTKIQILCPIVFSSNSDINNIILKYEKLGFSRLMHENEITTFSEIDTKNTDISKLKIIIDRVMIKKDIYKRLLDSVELGYKIGNGKIFVRINNEERIFCENNINPKTGDVFPKLTPKFFSYNRPEGACPTCKGVGTEYLFHHDTIIFDNTLTIEDGAIHLINSSNPYIYNLTLNFLDKLGLRNKNLNKYTKAELNQILLGSSETFDFSFKAKGKSYELSKTKFPGVLNWLNNHIDKDDLKKEVPCTSCNNAKLNPLSLSTYFFNKNIHELCNLNINDLHSFFSNCNYESNLQELIQTIHNQILYKLKLLKNIGLDYLHLNRKSSTLSGGETQRLNIATQLGSKLSGVLYILDEPSLGIHSSESTRLLNNIKSLKDNGNSVITVEHDLDIIKNSDYIIELGPKSGKYGGEIVAASDFESFISNKNTLTSNFLNNFSLTLKKEVRSIDKKINFTGIKKNNLQEVNVSFPLNCLTTITGISGSGKTTLVNDILADTCLNFIKKKITLRNTDYNSVTGLENIKSLIKIDSKPIGKSPNSIPATFLELYKYIRDIFAATNESKIRGYTAKRFSFNVKGGRCDQCEGKGKIKIDMHFMADIWTTCHICNGSRFNIDTLSILYKGLNIADVLNLTAAEALDFFSNHHKLSNTLKLLCSLDLSYIKLGQSSLQLSGGEAQRLKIVRELSKRTNGHTLYLLDEPTSGLHTNEIVFLIDSLNNLVDEGNTVIAIEHNLDLISKSDHIIDLGPEAGPNGGEIIFSGSPSDILKCKESKTGFELNKLIK